MATEVVMCKAYARHRVSEQETVDASSSRSCVGDTTPRSSAPPFVNVLLSTGATVFILATTYVYNAWWEHDRRAVAR